MLAKALSAWAIAALVPLVQAQKKSTYDFEGYPGDHKKWVPKKGCNLLIQAPADSKPWDDKAWDYVQKCDQAKVFPYCVSDQATDGTGRSLQDIANLVYANKENGLNPAWGGDHFYVVYLPDATKKNREWDIIQGASTTMRRIDKDGWSDGPGYTVLRKWNGDQVKCPNPYKWSMEEKFVY